MIPASRAQYCCVWVHSRLMCFRQYIRALTNTGIHWKKSLMEISVTDKNSVQSARARKHYWRDTYSGMWKTSYRTFVWILRKCTHLQKMKTEQSFSNPIATWIDLFKLYYHIEQFTNTGAFCVNFLIQQTKKRILFSILFQNVMISIARGILTMKRRNVYGYTSDNWALII